MERQYAFVGLGAANSLLFLKMARAGFWKEHSAVIFEPDAKSVDDKTYCFWARPDEPIVTELDEIIKHSWSAVEVGNGALEELGELRYYMVESLSLYHLVRRSIEKEAQVLLVCDSVSDLKECEGGLLIKTKHKTYFSHEVFDSRTPAFVEELGSTVLQSFKGVKIRTVDPVFNNRVMRLMDFNIPQDGYIQFMYVLPLSSREALVEFTRFGIEVVTEELADERLREYIDKMGSNHTVIAEERGVIPMSQNIATHHSDYRIISTGVRGGNMKATTGYAFKSMFEHASEILDAKRAAAMPRVSLSSRFLWYDFLLLFILKFRPHWGKEIFTRLFKTQPTHEVLQFLDQKSSLAWELKMFVQLPIRKFLWSVVSSTFAYTRCAPQRWLPLTLCLVVLLLEQIPLLAGIASNAAIGFLLFMLFLYGIPHGALDGYTLGRDKNWASFLLSYVGIMVLVLLMWYLSPSVGVLTFFVYSAWHFGETDLSEWRIPSAMLSFVWGAIVLGVMVFSHITEVNTVFEFMFVPALHVAEGVSTALALGLAVLGVLLAIRAGSFRWFLSVLVLVLSTQLSLALAFGIYFVLQHSLTGWNHLRVQEQWTNKNMWIKALPFTAGALVLFGLFTGLQPQWMQEWSAYFLIFLSALSLPHIYFMSRWYKTS